MYFSEICKIKKSPVLIHHEHLVKPEVKVPILKCPTGGRKRTNQQELSFVCIGPCTSLTTAAAYHNSQDDHHDQRPADDDYEDKNDDNAAANDEDDCDLDNDIDDDDDDNNDDKNDVFGEANDDDDTWEWWSCMSLSLTLGPSPNYLH